MTKKIIRLTVFRVGDQVKVINYGHPYWVSDSRGGLTTKDTTPSIIGKVGIVTKAHITQGIDQYSISGIPAKTAWYQNDQLQLIHRPKYRKA